MREAAVKRIPPGIDDPDGGAGIWALRQIVAEAEERMARILKHDQMIGAKAAPLKVEHWVSGACGAIRGTETLTVLGPAFVCWLRDSVTRQQAIASGEAYRLVIPPGVPHAIRAVGFEPMAIVAFNSQRFDRDQPDALRHVLLE